MRNSNYPEAWALAIIGLLIVVFGSQLAHSQTFVPWEEHPNFDGQTRLAFNADNDCSVIALAIACDIPYHRSHWIHRDHLGRKCAQCYTNVQDFYLGIGKALNELHLIGNIIVRPSDSPITVRQLAMTVQDQFIYVGVDGHALAIVNGIVFDNSVEPALDMVVRSAFTIQRKPPTDSY